jgi:hypothetical protein
MFLSLDNLGEKSLNKLAEIAVSSQFKKAEKLKVEVKVNANQLSRGIVDSLAIDGQGLVMKQNLEMQEMKIFLKDISVSPFKALMGNIQLTQPSEGEAYIILSENDLKTAFQCENFKKQLENCGFSENDKPVNIVIKNIDSRFLEGGKISLKAEILIKETSTIQEVILTTVPRVCPVTGKGISLGDVQCIKGEAFSSLFIKTLLEQTQKIFNLTNFQWDGFSLIIDQLNFVNDKFIFQGVAGISNFPPDNNSR